MGLLFKFGQAVPESRDIPIFVYTRKNWDFLEFLVGVGIGAFEHWNGTKKQLFLVL